MNEIMPGRPESAPALAGQRPGRLLACVLLSGCALVPLTARAEAPVSPGQKFQMALEAQSIGEYTRMLGLLREAAQEGNVPAQEMLGMVLLAGSTVYGEAVPADRCEAGAWMRRAAAQGSELGRAQWRFLHRLRYAPSGKDFCQTEEG